MVSSLRQIIKPGYGLAARSHTFSSATTGSTHIGGPVSLAFLPFFYRRNKQKQKKTFCFTFVTVLCCAFSFIPFRSFWFYRFFCLINVLNFRNENCPLKFCLNICTYLITILLLIHKFTNFIVMSLPLSFWIIHIRAIFLFCCVNVNMVLVRRCSNMQLNWIIKLLFMFNLFSLSHFIFDMFRKVANVFACFKIEKYNLKYRITTKDSKFLMLNFTWNMHNKKKNENTCTCRKLFI